LFKRRKEEKKKRRKLENSFEKIINTDFPDDNLICEHEHEHNNDNDMYISPDEETDGMCIDDNDFFTKTLNLKQQLCIHGTYSYCTIYINVQYDISYLKDFENKFCLVDTTGTNFLDNVIYNIDMVNDKIKFNLVNMVCIICI